MRIALWLPAALLAAAALAPDVAAQEEDARRNLSAFEACAGIADDEDRHRCLDNALRTTGMIDDQAAEDRARANYGRSEAAIERERRQEIAREQETARGQGAQETTPAARSAPAARAARPRRLPRPRAIRLASPCSPRSRPPG